MGRTILFMRLDQSLLLKTMSDDHVLVIGKPLLSSGQSPCLKAGAGMRSARLPLSRSLAKTEHSDYRH